MHDGSPEVMDAFARFGERESQPGSSAGGSEDTFSGGWKLTTPSDYHNDTGTAARFFKECPVDTREGEASAERRYTNSGSTNFAALPGQRREDGGGSPEQFYFCAKAAADERIGNHPTVKPVALMEWLVRLVCPRMVACSIVSPAPARRWWRAIAWASPRSESNRRADGGEPAKKLRRMRARRMIGGGERPTVAEGQLRLL